MKKKFTYFVAAVCAALTFSACSSDKLEAYSGQTLENPESPSNAISFGTYMGKTGTTRTVVEPTYVKGTIGNSTDAAKGLTDLKNARFGVFAYYTQATDYDPAAGTGTWRTGGAETKYPNFMYNQELIYGTSTLDAWVYDPVKYWPNGKDAANSSNPSTTATQKQEGKLSFYAFAPYTAATATAYSGDVPSGVSSNGVTAAKTMTTGNTSGVTAITGNDSPSNVWVKYLMPNAQVDEAVDLLWGVRGQKVYTETDNVDNGSSSDVLGNTYNINLTKQIVTDGTNTQKVKFLFKHALAKMGGQTVTSEDVSLAPSGEDQIGFKVIADIDINDDNIHTGDHDNQATYLGSDFDKSKTLITLKAVKIRDGKTAYDNSAETGITTSTSSNIANAGWFNIETGTWEGGAVETTGATVNIIAESKDANQTSAGDTDYSINPEIREVATYSKSDGSGVKKLASGGETWGSGNPTGVFTTAVPVFAKENIPGLLFIPTGETTQDLYVTVDYVVRTADKNLASGFSEVEQVITNKVSLASLAPNKKYTIIMHLGLTSVKFEAKVADWATTVGGTYDENGTFTPGTGSDAEENESTVWLPSNVIIPAP